MDLADKTDAQLVLQQRTGRQIEDMLRDLYVRDKASDADIAKAFSAELLRAGRRPISRATVRNWRISFGISVDDRPAVAL